MIRRATVADHEWIADLAADVYGDLGDYGTIMRSWLGHAGVLAYMDETRRPGASATCHRGFTLLGFYHATGEEEPAYPAGVLLDRFATGLPVYVADLLAIAVGRPYQRQGVGKGLLGHAIHLAGLAGRQGPVAQMRLTVAETNEVGRRFFDSYGFEVLDEHHGTYDGGQRAIRMVRPLP